VPSFEVADFCSTTRSLVSNWAGRAFTVWAVVPVASASFSWVGVRKPSLV
jgi:hypothetical protein